MRVLEAARDYGRDALDGVTIARPGANDRENLSQRAYSHIRSRLICGNMRPGEKLILRPLAARLGLSPTPVREALLRLVSEQALSLDDRGSAIVPVMAIEQFREMCDLRSDLESRAAERAATSATPADLDQLQAICDESLGHYTNGTYQQLLESNACFHRMVCQVGRSPLIRHVLEGMWIRLGPPYAIALSRPYQRMAVEDHPHQLLMKALRAGDAAAARDAALRDVRASQRVISGTLQPA